MARTHIPRLTSFLVFFLYLLSTWSARIAAPRNAVNVSQILPDPVILPIPRYKPYFVNETKIDPDERNYDHRGGNLVVTNYPFSVVAPASSFRVTVTASAKDFQNYFNHHGDIAQHNNSNDLPQLPLQKTSIQARDHRCDIAASNGGPFDPDGWTTGPTVMDGQLVRTKQSNVYDSNFVGIGTAVMDGSKNDSSSHYWVLGSYHQIIMMNDPSRTVSFLNFATGFQWLVYDGKSLADNSHNPTGADRAPRTAVGLDGDSNLILLVVDGCEKCFRQRGLTLEELAKLLIEQGAMYAINMDGGGSSTLVSGMDHHVINRPTCLDVPKFACQRPVASVLCVSASSITTSS